MTRSGDDNRSVPAGTAASHPTATTVESCAGSVQALDTRGAVSPTASRPAFQLFCTLLI